MNKERILNIINYYNLKLSDEDVNRIIEEFKDVNVEENTLNQMILSRIKKIMDEHIETRHIKGGESTRQLFLRKRQVTL